MLVIKPMPDVSSLLGEAWERWADRCADLTDGEWSTPTRCRPWDVHALAAHVAPDPAVIGQLGAAGLDVDAAVTDAADLLRGFNQPDGVANTMAGAVAAFAIAAAKSMPRSQVIERFRQCSALVRDGSSALDVVVPHPIVGSTTIAVLADVAMMEATVHYLDLIAAVGGPPLPSAVLAHTRALLVRIPEPAALIEVLAGRADPAAVLPVLR